MSYPERQQFEGAIYHIISRGNGKQNIFLGERDRRRFLRILEDVTKESRWLVLAYCLMGHHYHILLETPEPNLADGMQKLNGSYGTWFNRAHQRVGHLLQGRYRSPLVVRDSHFEWLTRYIVLNPVRSGFVESPEKWPWSSYAFMVSEAAEHPFLSPERVISTFGASRAEAAMEYARYVNEDLEESHQIAQEKRMTLQQILSLGSGGRPCDERIWRAYFVHHYRISDIATAAGLSNPTVSRILRRYPRRDYFVGS